jgi:hypothetical protein
MKLFLAHTVVFVGSIWKNKSGWFMIVVSLGLSVATEIVLTADCCRFAIIDFQPKFCSKSTPHNVKEPMKLFLAHTLVFVGSIWKNKSGWFLFPDCCVHGAVSGHRNCADCWGPSLIFNPSFAQNQPCMMSLNR